MIRLVLYKPDIPQNVGAILRLSACFNVPMDVIEPCGFVWDDKRIKRAAMDYSDLAEVNRHRSWESYKAADHAGRLVLLTTKAAVPYQTYTFTKDDRLLFGRESAGVPDDVHATADARLVIPMAAGARSLNLSQSAAIVAAEALRQLGKCPPG